MKMRLEIFFVASLLLTSLPAFGQRPATAAEPGFRAHFYFPREWYGQGQSEPDLQEPEGSDSDATRNRAGGFSSLPAATATNVVYHNGSVMLTATVYTIYWGPSGHAIPSDYSELINQWFTDLEGSSFYNILTQYYEGNPHQFIKNTVTLGGSWVDTINPYPHTGTGADPITDANIQAEVRRAIDTNGWPDGGSNVAFFVFTAKGIESCVGTTECTIGTAHPVYCAYHSAFSGSSDTVIYANMPYGGTWSSGFPYNCGNLKSPNNEPDADEEISTTSHELFESVSDPTGGGWWDTSGEEMADKCAYTYGTIAADGHNVILNGHSYIVQKEWSNAVGHCALQYGAGAPVATATPTRTRTPTPALASRTPTKVRSATPTRTPTQRAVRTPTLSRRGFLSLF